VVTVNPLPTAISGALSVCVNANITWSAGPAAGTWTSSTTSVATVTSPGITTSVRGVSAGTSTITFTLGTGCSVTRVVTVNPIPLPIAGTLSVCQGQTTTLSDPSGGGTWSATPGAIATIGSGTGVAGGVAGGTATVTYTFTLTGCYITAPLTVNPTPAILGTPVVCAGSCITLSETITGGTWSSSNTGVATASGAGPSTGNICGVSAGTATITYTFATGCISTRVVTVNPIPIAVTGPTSLCQGATITLTDTDPGGPGTWSSSTLTVATVVAGPATTTTVTGVGGGTALITYTLPTTCYTTYAVTVNPITPILGNPNICITSTTSLSDATGGGGWSSSNMGVATVTTTGGSTTTVTGVTVGTATISYLMGSGCLATIDVTVNPLPSAILGLTSVCTGNIINLSDVGGGTWTSSDGSVATVTLGPTSPTTVGGAGAGTAVITYTLPTACFVTTTITVLQSPAAITGVAAVCIGQTTILSDGTGGGTWSSSNTGVATVTTGGSSTTVTGVATGTSIISYIVANGCYATRVVTVNLLPSGITGGTVVCAGGSTITLSDVVGGGTWSSSSGGIATVTPGPSSTTTVTGVGAGTVTITYSLSTGCNATYIVTVLAQPTAIITPMGSLDICPGGFVSLTANTGILLTYQWSIGGAPIPGATASTYTATTGGSYTVKVTAGTTGCSQTSAPAVVTIRAVTATITVPGGTTTACASPGVTMNAGPAGMTYQWQLGTTAIGGATASTYTGSVTGTYNVIVTNTFGCSDTASQAITINPSPANTVTLSGSLSFCGGDSVVITGTTGAGYTYQWHNTAGIIAGATNPAYTARVSGTYWVVITNSTGCSTPSVNNIVAVTPAPVFTVTPSGVTTFCAGGNVTMTVSPTAGFTFQWYLNGTPIPGANLSSYTAASTGNYSVKVTSTGTGCSIFSPVTPVASITSPVMVPLTATMFCWGGSAPLAAVVAGATSVVQYQWYVNGSLIPGATNSTYNATIPGTYKVIINVPSSCFLTSANVSVTQNPLPDPMVHFDGTTWFTTQNYFVTYQWYKNNVAIMGATSYTTRATSNGNYKVAVTDTNGCQSVSDVYPLTGWTPPANVGVSPVGLDQAIKIYPNPAANSVYIDAPMNVRATICGIDGKVFIDKRSASNIDISALADGIYIIRVYDDTGMMVKTEKLVKAAN
jgi:trimeric autotransporter adhesin